MSLILLKFCLFFKIRKIQNNNFLNSNLIKYSTNILSFFILNNYTGSSMSHHAFLNTLLAHVCLKIY